MELLLGVEGLVLPSIFPKDFPGLDSSGGEWLQTLPGLDLCTSELEVLGARSRVSTIVSLPIHCVRHRSYTYVSEVFAL